jgi:Leucine-rich repeat (LRR) protein
VTKFLNEIFQVCPLVVEGAENVQVLCYSRNLITKIERMDNFHNVVTLDLLGNQIEVWFSYIFPNKPYQKIDGLESLVSLRVLNLGKNKISSTEIRGVRETATKDIHLKITVETNRSS